MTTFKIASEFSFVPAGRYVTDGAYTGERFREEFLKPMLERENVVEIDIDGAAGYGSSFLEEAFGGLVRKGYFSAKQLHERLKIINRDPEYSTYQVSIWRFIDAAKSE